MYDGAAVRQIQQHENRSPQSGNLLRNKTGDTVPLLVAKKRCHRYFNFIRYFGCGESDE
jgi:hypothetical protein